MVDMTLKSSYYCCFDVSYRYVLFLIIFLFVVDCFVLFVLFLYVCSFFSLLLL